MNRAKKVLDVLNILYPNASCELKYNTAFQLTLAVMLSAQTTDVSVNKACEQLFLKYYDACDFTALSISDFEDYFKTLGLYKIKAKNAFEMAQIVCHDFDNIVPNSRKLLQTLPGVGRKTASVVLAEIFAVPSIAVDTHVARVSKRLGLAKEEDDVLAIEVKLKRKFKSSTWIKLHHQLIFFGRYHCKSRNPNCSNCLLFDICKYKDKKNITI